MTVGLFSAPERGDEVRQIMQTLRGNSIRSRGVTIARDWAASDGGRLRSALNESTHVLLLPPLETFSDWVTYVLGFAAGREMPAAVVGECNMPTVHLSVPVVERLNIEDHVLAARSVWQGEALIERARARLGGRDRDPDAFYRAAAHADLQAVDDYLIVGLSPNAQSTEGVPVLVAAVRGRSTEVVQRLINAGADPNGSCGENGVSPLCEAASLGLETVLGVLLAQGADPNQVTADGQTALMLAASRGHVDLIDTLLKAGADPSRVDSLGMNAAEYARLFGREEILSSLEEMNRS
ncbi:MAG: ankyrin repeat domain-containing protein [Spirochaetota bacterium]